MPVPATPALTTDIIIELVDRPGHPIVLIERRFPPLGWALPGGFVDVGKRWNGRRCARRWKKPRSR